MKFFLGVRNALIPSLLLWLSIIWGLSQCFAQSQDKPTANSRSLLDRVNVEISNNLACVERNYAMQDEINRLKAQIAELQSKTEPKDKGE